MHHHRTSLIASLPVEDQDLTIRPVERQDLDLRAAWPDYSWPFDVFVNPFRGLNPTELDDAYAARYTPESCISLVVDTPGCPVAATISLVDIDWSTGISHNMGVRVRPDQCDKGIGSRILTLLRQWWFAHGMTSLQLDVAATNPRAVACYLNAGFQITGELWREAPDLAGKDQTEERYAFLGDHVNPATTPPTIRFYTMATAAP